jgi:ABC-2 type transport system ATP-binding protein/lipopolysaccharide transport system ATP-binding protein
MAGIYQPDKGQVKVDGRISTLLELGAGFHPDLSGRENIYMNATMLGMSKKSISKVFDDIVAFAGVEQFVDSPVKVYSTGMYVRLGFSVAVHVQPEILIIDEVIAVGDEQFQRRCFDHLYGLRKEGVTIVVVTHGMSTVQTMCDRAAWLDHGVLQMEGKAPEVSLAYLQAVNRAEVEDPTQHATVGPPATDDSSLPVRVAPKGVVANGEHWGSGEVRITDVQFLGPDGDGAGIVAEGALLRVRISYETDITVEQPTFGIAIHTEGGIHVTGTNTRLSKHSTGVISGSGWVEYTTERLPILPGTYMVSIAIEDHFSQHTYDRYDQAWRLRVRHDGEQVVHGLVDIGGDWIIQGASVADPAVR